MAFGIGLGLKDGVGKATEFFAGYAEFCVVFSTTVRSFTIELIKLKSVLELHSQWVNQTKELTLTKLKSILPELS